MTTSTVKYQKLQLRDQILLRPDTYIGSTRTLLTTDPAWIYNSLINKFEFKQVKINDGLIRLVIEVISNAIDNVWRSTEEKIIPHFIKINVDKYSVSVWNDGKEISTHKHDSENMPIPELIFGNLLTSSNYNDKEERRTSGKNGIGAKACNLFSTKFELDIFNKTEKVLYNQEWTNNMTNKTEPKLITKGFPTTIEEGKNGYTKVTFYPDFQRFGETEFNEEHLCMIKKLAIDAAMTVSFNKIKVIYNDVHIVINDLSDYVNYFFKKEDSEEETEEEKEELFISTSDCKVYLKPSSKKEFTQVSFVNGIQTTNGGVHVDGWCEAFFRPLITRINAKKDKSLHIDIRDIKKYFFIFIFCSIDKPSFDSQSKTRLTAPSISVEIKSSHITKLMKWSFIEQIEDSLKIKELASLKKSTERKKGFIKVEGLDDANLAGTKHSQDCSLAISEGLSAKTYIIQGMKEGFKQFQNKSGRDFIGVLPIRGKFLNAKNASAQMLGNNKEVNSIIKTLGLEWGIDYTLSENRTKLRYGRLIVSTDADVDGTHISALLYNFFQTCFPSLLTNNDFFYFMRVPIIKIDNGKKAPISFFDKNQADKYIEDNKISKNKIKYFKGLGTANTLDIKQDFGRRIVQLVTQPTTELLMNNIFSKDNTAYRKQWISSYVKSSDIQVVEDYSIEALNIDNFINNELIQFSIDDCKRSIPHILDGLKESHRKIMFATFKRNLKYSGQSMKVAQFGAYTAEISGYHHGENNLLETITKMAQRFVGTNNIPLLYNDGQFGSRLENGQDAANGRYIFTKLDKYTRLIFKEEDEDYLTDLEEDGDIIEKQFYVPIIPMVLVNNTIGSIGTGFSSQIPGYNPKDIIQWILCWLDGDEKNDLIPFYRNFLGKIEKAENNNFISYGVFNEIKKDTYRITEIPIGKLQYSISKYKSILEDLREDSFIKTIKDNCTESLIDFTITVQPGTVLDNKKLKLIDNISTSNMVLFSSNNIIKKYNTIDDILNEYCEVRLELYSTRRKGQLVKLKYELNVIKNKINFIQYILDDKIILKNKDEETIYNELIKLKFIQVDNKFDYLLNMTIKTMTSNKIRELTHSSSNIETQINVLDKMSASEIWKQELNELFKNGEFIIR